MNNKTLLVVQFRHGAEVAQEQKCFLAEFPELENKVTFVNATEEAMPTDLSPYAGLLLAGSAQYYLSKPEGIGPWQQDVFDLLDAALEKEMPVLGICFGFQLIASHQGATLTRIPEQKQSGTFMVTRFETGHEDELLGHLPEEHAALFAHQDAVVELPDHIVPLCRTERVECTSFRLAGKRVWGTLYHPELNGHRVVERMSLIPDGGSGYRDGKSDEEVLALFSPTPEAASVLHRFAEIVFPS